MPLLVCFAGLPGVGKSSVARVLAAETGALWLRIDAVEQALRESHMQVMGGLADGGYAALRAVAEAALVQGFDVVVDSVNPLPITRMAWRDVSARAGARHRDVELVCSDADAHRRRVERHVPDVPGLVLSDWAAVRARDYAPMDADLRLDTARLSVAQSVVAIRALIAQEEG